MSGYRIGFVGSLLFHGGLSGIWWVLADSPRPNAKPLDHSLPLTLALFQEAPGARHELGSAAVRGVPPRVSTTEAATAPLMPAPHAAQRTAKQAPLPVVRAPGIEAQKPRVAEKRAVNRRPIKAAPATDSRRPRTHKTHRQWATPKQPADERSVVTSSTPNATAPIQVAASQLPGHAQPAPAAQRAAAARAAALEGAYLDRLWGALERSKFYPRQARRKGLQGLVQIRFRVLRDGSFGDLEVVRGSGSRLLDEAAVQTVNKVSGTVPFPRDLSKSALVVNLPIACRLQ